MQYKMYLLEIKSIKTAKKEYNQKSNKNNLLFI